MKGLLCGRGHRSARPADRLPLLFSILPLATMTQYVFEMGMTCGGCANAARKVLGKLGEDKLRIDDINVETKLITVTTDLSSDEVLEQLKKTGKEVKLVQ